MASPQGVSGSDTGLHWVTSFTRKLLTLHSLLSSHPFGWNTDTGPGSRPKMTSDLRPPEEWQSRWTLCGGGQGHPSGSSLSLRCNSHVRKRGSRPGLETTHTSSRRHLIFKQRLRNPSGTAPDECNVSSEAMGEVGTKDTGS